METVLLSPNYLAVFKICDYKAWKSMKNYFISVFENLKRFIGICEGFIRDFWHVH